MYNYYHNNYTFIKGDNMELIELNRSIEDAKVSYELAKTKKEYYYYKSIIEELRSEKQELLNNEFKRNC